LPEQIFLASGTPERQAYPAGLLGVSKCSS
jgi:hypothetical protein